MAESSNSEMGQDKGKNKIPIEEDGPISCGSSGEDCGGEATEAMGKKRKKRKRENKTAGGSLFQDPLVVFGSDIMMKILRHLDACSVALSLLVSRRWYGVASSNRLWASKVRFDVGLT